MPPPPGRLRGARATPRRACRSSFRLALAGQCWAKARHRSRRRIAGNPPGCGRDRERESQQCQRDGQQGQHVPEGNHHDDAGEDPEGGGLRVVGAMVSVVCRMRLTALELFLFIAVADDGCPSALAGISQAGTVCNQLHFFQDRRSQ